MALYLHEISHLRWAPTWRTINLHKCMTSAANQQLSKSFEVPSAVPLVFFQNISPFSKRIKPKSFDTFSAATESNAQRNKPSLRGKKSSGVTHFRKSHLIRYGVVMLGCKEHRKMCWGDVKLCQNFHRAGVPRIQWKRNQNSFKKRSTECKSHCTENVCCAEQPEMSSKSLQSLREKSGFRQFYI